MKKNFEQHFWGNLGLLIVIFLIFTAFLFFLTFVVATGKTIKVPLIMKASKLTKNYYSKLSLKKEENMKLSAQAERMVEKAKIDLSAKIGIEEEKINLVDIKEKNWPDTSLGCPLPGMFYAQVITPGFKITLEGGGKNYTYHSDYKRIVLCPSVK